MRVEWPTLALIVACYGLWAMALWMPLFVALPVLIVTITLQSSLQHEVLHGHPFAHQRLNEALAVASLNLAIPYLRFRDTHLAHHRDAALTDPYDDPESNYLDPAVWARLPALLRWVLRANNTLAGRMVFGPLLTQVRFMFSDARAMVRRERSVTVGWAVHLAACVPVIGLVAASPLPLSAYALACYAALSVLKIRTFLEHQAHERCSERTVIVESRGPLAFLFLNNNFHAVHHLHPQVAWYDLPALYRAKRTRYLQRNGDYRYSCYGAVFRRHFLRAKDPVAHPHFDPPR